MSTTNHIWSVFDPSTGMFSCFLVQLWAPSHPIRYFALIVSTCVFCGFLRGARSAQSSGSRLLRFTSMPATSVSCPHDEFGSSSPRTLTLTVIGYASGSSLSFSSYSKESAITLRSTSRSECSRILSRRNRSMRPWFKHVLWKGDSSTLNMSI